MTPRHAVLLALLTASSAIAAPTDWPCFRGPNHDGTLAEKFTLVSGEPEALWRAKIGGGHASFAVVAGRLYTTAGGAGERVVCLDARTGDRVWAVSHLQSVSESTPTVEGGRVYVAHWGKNGPAAGAVSATDGKLLWEAPLPKSSGVSHYGAAGSPRAWEDLVFYNLAGGAAVRKDSGEVAWAHEGHTAYATPVMFTAKGKPAVAFFTGDSLIARDARTGRELWTIPWKTSLHVSACDPVFLGDRVFVCSAYGRGRALYDVGGASPRTLWEEHKDGSGNSYSSGFVHRGGLFFFTGNGFASVEVATGRLQWEYPGWARSIVIGDTMIWLGHKGELEAGLLDPARKFEPTVRSQVIGGKTWNVPAYWDGKLYVRNEAGDVACVKIAK